MPRCSVPIRNAPSTNHLVIHAYSGGTFNNLSVILIFSFGVIYAYSRGTFSNLSVILLLSFGVTHVYKS